MCITTNYISVDINHVCALVIKSCNQVLYIHILWLFFNMNVIIDYLYFFFYLESTTSGSMFERNTTLSWKVGESKWEY